MPGESPDAPLALTSLCRGRQVVGACCEVAAAKGVRCGMTLAHAAALAGPRLRWEPHEPARCAAALRAFAQWAMRFSPLVATDGPDGIVMDISGCQRFFGGERRLMDRLAVESCGMGFAARAAAAATIGCAYAVARFGKSWSIVADGAEPAALTELPTRSLRLEEQVVEALREVGVRRVGQLLALSRAALAKRFGAGPLARIDQALGKAWERVDALAPAYVPGVRMEFPGPVKQLQAVQEALRRLLDSLARKLERRRLGVRRLALTIRRCDCPPLELGVSLSRPSCDPRHLWKLLEGPLEKANLGFGVDALTLAAPQTGPLPYRQQSFLPQDAPVRLSRELGELADVLIARLGMERVTRLEPVESHMPERTFARRSVAADGLTGRPGARRASGPPARRDRPAPKRGDDATWGDRPSLLLDAPERVKVTTVAPEGPVLRFAWRGRNIAVKACAGPERIACEWWTEDAPAGAAPSTRDYYRLAAQDGQWLWLFRELETGNWFVHGIWC